MAIFSRYYKSNSLVEITMDEMEVYITDEVNKQIIADVIFHRYYDRYLKIFFFKSNKQELYTKNIEGKETSYYKDAFIEEYKNGFSIMTNCCLLIETIASFFEGQNETKKSGKETFKLIFKKAAEYNNELKCFENEDFYKNIRCGLLHQGETYGNFIIRRDALKLFDTTSKVINAKLFCDNLKLFLESYNSELVNAKWNSDIWDKCRIKIRHIIQNSR